MGVQNDTDPATVHKHDADGASAYMFPERINTLMKTKKEHFLQELGSVFCFEIQGIKKGIATAYPAYWRLL